MTVFLFSFLFFSFMIFMPCMDILWSYAIFLPNLVQWLYVNHANATSYPKRNPHAVNTA